MRNEARTGSGNDTDGGSGWQGWDCERGLLGVGGRRLG